MMPRVKVGNLTAGRNRAAEHDLLRRQNATGILAPEAVGGKVSASKFLYTTLSGAARQITAADLAHFRAQAASLGTKFRAGVAVADLIDGSLPDDLKRARDEVRWSTPARLHNGTIDFVTDASRESKATRHYVRISFGGEALTRASTPLQAAARHVSEGALEVRLRLRASHPPASTSDIHKAVARYEGSTDPNLAASAWALQALLASK